MNLKNRFVFLSIVKIWFNILQFQTKYISLHRQTNKKQKIMENKFMMKVYIGIIIATTLSLIGSELLNNPYDKLFALFFSIGVILMAIIVALRVS